MRNIFLEKSNTECGGKANPSPIYKKSKLTYLWINSVVFIVYPSRGFPKYIKTKVLTVYFYLISSFFLNYKQNVVEKLVPDPFIKKNQN